MGRFRSLGPFAPPWDKKQIRYKKNQPDTHQPLILHHSATLS